MLTSKVKSVHHFKARKELLGDRHPSVATSLNSLALLYKSQGRYEAAEPLYQLEQRAAQYGRTIEIEIKAILKSVLAPKKSSNIDLATAINRRFAGFGDFEIPEIPREPMRSLPTFDMGDL